MTFRDRIQPQLRDWYDTSAGFDFEHLEEFGMLPIRQTRK